MMNDKKRLPRMDKDKRFNQIKKAHERLRWAGLSSDPDFVQLCHEMVDYNARRIEKVLKSTADCKIAYEFLTEYNGELFPTVSDQSLVFAQEFQATTQILMCHFCECVDIQSNFLMMQKNMLISQNDSEVALIYRHIQVDVVRAFQKLDCIDKYIRENDVLFSVETERRECNKQKSELDTKYGIRRGPMHEDRNRIAAHWDEVDYMDIYNNSKNVHVIQINDICMDMFNLTQSYSNCLRNALNNYLSYIIDKFKDHK